PRIQVFCEQQRRLALPVRPLEPRLGGVGAAMVFEVELAIPCWQVLPPPYPLVQPREILVGAAKLQAWQSRQLLQRIPVLDHLAGRSGAAVAEAKRQQQLVVQ